MKTEQKVELSEEEILLKTGQDFIEFIERIMADEGVTKSQLRWQQTNSTKEFVKQNRVTELMSRIKNGKDKGYINAQFKKKLMSVFHKQEKLIENKVNEYNSAYDRCYGPIDGPASPTSQSLLKLKDYYIPESLNHQTKNIISIEDYIAKKNDPKLYRPFFCILYLIFSEAIGLYEHELLDQLNHNNRIKTKYLKSLKKDFQHSTLKGTIKLSLMESNTICSSINESSRVMRLWNNFLKEADYPFEWSLGSPSTNKILIHFIPTGDIYSFTFY